jgi:hypothetical protein
MMWVALYSLGLNRWVPDIVLFFIQSLWGVFQVDRVAECSVESDMARNCNVCWDFKQLRAARDLR